MINEELNEVLKCVKCKAGNLKISSSGNELICINCEARYNILKNVPLLIDPLESETFGTSEVHENYGTVFKYIDHYRKDAQVYDYFAERDSETEHTDRRVREYIDFNIRGKSGRILDVGCGKAWVAELFCPRDYSVVSMDISIENTSEAIKKYPFKNHSAIVGDVYSLPFRNNSFDYIIASEVIEHVYSPDALVSNLINILKPGGVLIITTPYREKIQYSLCIHCNRPTPHNAHLHSFDEKILTSLYKEDDIKNLDFTTFANKLLIHVRLNFILKYLNFYSWRLLDNLINKIYKVPSRILVKWEKRM